MTNTYERLEGYYPFDEDILDTLSDVAEQQQSMGYQEYLEELGVPKPTLIDKNAQVIDIVPAEDYDEKHARVIHLPMANPLDANMTYQGATIYATDPSVRTLIVANPSGVGYGYGLLNRADRKQVAQGELRPTIDAVSKFLNKSGVETVDHVGYSYGADKAAAAAEHADKYDMDVVASVHIEPAAVVMRSLKQLGQAFASTDKALKSYVNASGVEAFLDARKVSVKNNYFVGLTRPVNIAIARALAKDGFEGRMDRALTAQPEMISTIIWGTESELAIDGITTAIANRLIDTHGDRVAKLRLPGQKHALANDIHLHAALVMHGLGEKVV